MKDKLLNQFMHWYNNLTLLDILSLLVLILLLGSIVKFFINNGTTTQYFIYGITILSSDLLVNMKSVTLESLMNNISLKMAILYVLIFAITIIYLLYSNETGPFHKVEFLKNPLTYLLIMIVSISIGLYFFYLPVLRNKSMDILAITGGIAFFLVALFCVFLYRSLSNEQMYYIMWLITGISFLIIVIGLAIFAYIFNNYLKTLSGWSGFFAYFIFYIPCLVVDFIEYMKADIKSTPNTVFILFVIEIILILLYLYLPYAMNKAVNSKGKILLKGNVYLNEEYTIGLGNDLKIKSLSEPNVFEKTTTSNQNFSISMWTYINAQPGRKEETNIFNYGNGKPKIIYNCDLSNGFEKNKYRIYFTNETSDVKDHFFDFTMMDQKWNNIVVNYTSTLVDLFINGKLEKTFYFQPVHQAASPIYLPDDAIVVGANNGLFGSICSVKYFFHPQTKFEIANTYNLLMYSNPPVVADD